MNRLLSTMWLDLRLQLRNGLFYASGFVALVFVVLLRQFRDVDLRPIWPAIILENLIINAYYLMSGMVLLEKREGTLEVQVVTPLRKEEYLISKVLTLGLLSLVETLVIVILVQGLRFRWLPLVAGLLLMVAFYALYGFVTVSRYDSINEFLMPSAVWTMGFSLPLIYFFDLWRHWIFYLHPLQAPLVLMQAAFVSVAPWQIVYGLAYGALWVGVVFWLSRRAFHRFVIVKEGTR